MPDREQIISRLKRLPAIPVGQEAEDNEIWEGDELGAHFKVTKETILLPKAPNIPDSLTMYGLSLSGHKTGVGKIISDFVNVLGDPMFPPEYLPYLKIIMVAWDTQNTKPNSNTSIIQ